MQCLDINRDNREGEREEKGKRERATAVDIGRYISKVENSPIF